MDCKDRRMISKIKPKENEKSKGFANIKFSFFFTFDCFENGYKFF